MCVFDASLAYRDNEEHMCVCDFGYMCVVVLIIMYSLFRL